MTRKECRKANKNAGFSLLELLIAVIILAIIVIPLLHMFVTSTRINIKSRQTLRATTFAQDIMEGLKAYNIDELKQQFNEPVEGFYVINDKLIKGSVQEDIDREKAANGTDLNGNPNPGLYYFTMSGVAMQGSEYDALIEVDARGYMENAPDSVPDSEKSNYGDSSVTIDGKSYYLNNDQFSVISSVDKERDGVFKEDDEVREKVLKDANEHFYHEGGGTDPDWDWESEGFDYGSSEVSVSRTITVDITDAGTDAEGNPLFDAAITYEYVWNKVGSMGDYISYGLQGSANTQILDLPCGDGVSSGNFYLFYYPLYHSYGEDIIINNEADAPLRLFIVKQIDTTTDAALTDAQLSAAEQNYDTIVEIAEGSLDKIEIRTNLGFNLANEKFLAGEGMTSELPAGQVQYWYKGSPANEDECNIYKLTGVRNNNFGAAGTNNDITEVIYDVTVSVYEAGAAANGFPDEDRMVVISGSKNN